MGYNIAGLVISNNFEKNIQKLEDDLMWDIEIVEEITFEEASSNWTPDGEFRLFFTDKATIIFYPHEWISERYSSHKSSSMSYAYSATSMTFFISYNNLEENYGRFIISNDGEIQLSEGQEIPYEKEGHPVDAIIFKLIDDLIDDNYHNIDMEAKAFRCRKLNPQTKRLKYIEEQIPEKVTENEKKVKIKSTITITSEDKTNGKNNLRKWWQFWK